MAGENMVTQVRKGMKVKTSDGVEVGKVAMVWLGIDPTANSPRCDEALCSRIEVRRGFFANDVRYIPFPTIASVVGKTVTLSADHLTIEEKGWQSKPRWIPARKGHWDADDNPDLT